jgi:hypothetical protein
MKYYVSWREHVALLYFSKRYQVIQLVLQAYHHIWWPRLIWQIPWRNYPLRWSMHNKIVMLIRIVTLISTTGFIWLVSCCNGYRYKEYILAIRRSDMCLIKVLYKEKASTCTEPINVKSPCCSDSNIEKVQSADLEQHLYFKFVHSSLVSYWKSVTSEAANTIIKLVSFCW